MATSQAHMHVHRTPFAGDKIDELYANISKGEFEIPEVSQPSQE